MINREQVADRLCDALNNFSAESVSTDVLLALAVMLETAQGTRAPSLGQARLRVVKGGR